MTLLVLDEFASFTNDKEVFALLKVQFVIESTPEFESIIPCHFSLESREVNVAPFAIRVAELSNKILEPAPSFSFEFGFIIKAD